MSTLTIRYSLTDHYTERTIPSGYFEEFQCQYHIKMLSQSEEQQHTESLLDILTKARLLDIDLSPNYEIEMLNTKFDIRKIIIDTS